MTSEAIMQEMLLPFHQEPCAKGVGDIQCICGLDKVVSRLEETFAAHDLTRLLPHTDNALREAADSAQAWLERWAQHVGNCEGGMKCSCGLFAIQFELTDALLPPDNVLQSKTE